MRRIGQCWGATRASQEVYTGDRRATNPPPSYAQFITREKIKR
jgi:hypothetical protein